MHKKGNKDLINNYEPMSLLPISSKIYEKSIYDTLYKYFDGNYLFSKSQSGFRKADSCVSQLLPITHKIFRGFGANPSLDTCEIVLNISKVFDRVCHKALIFKLRSYGISDSLLRLFNSFLSERLQRVVLNGQASEWRKELSGVPQGSILGPLLFLISINDIVANIECKVKIFADHTSLFSLVRDPNEISAKLGRELRRVAQWVHQWKMSFNLDPSKQAVEVHFTRKINSLDTSPVYFNNLAVASCETHKHLSLLLDKRLPFDRHVEEMILRANKGVGLITRLRRYLRRNSLLTIYKALIRPHLDYGDVVYDYPGNASFMQELESVQYNASLAITGCFRGTSRDKLYSELGLESLADRRFYRRLIAFYAIVSKKASQYLIDYLPSQDLASVNLTKAPAIYPLDARTERYRISFFPYCILQWKNLDSRIRNFASVATFKRAILDFIRPNPTPYFKTNRLSGFVFLTRLRKFRHCFLDVGDPICSCRTNAVENTEHYLLHCSNFTNQRTVFFDDLRNIGINYGPLDSSTLSRMFLFGNPKFSDNVNSGIIYVVIKFIE